MGLPILPALLQAPQPQEGAELAVEDARLREARGFVDSYGLNDDQETALKSTAGWFAGDTQARLLCESSSPTCILGKIITP